MSITRGQVSYTLYYREGVADNTTTQPTYLSQPQVMLACERDRIVGLLLLPCTPDGLSSDSATLAGECMREVVQRVRALRCLNKHTSSNIAHLLLLRSTLMIWWLGSCEDTINLTITQPSSRCEPHTCDNFFFVPSIFYFLLFLFLYAFCFFQTSTFSVSSTFSPSVPSWPCQSGTPDKSCKHPKSLNPTLNFSVWA